MKKGKTAKPARLRVEDIRQQAIAHEAWKRLQKDGFKAASNESGNPMAVTDAARQAMMSPRQVFRYLKAGGVDTALGFVTLKRDRAGMISLTRLQMIRALRDSFVRPGRRYGAPPHRRDNNLPKKARPQRNKRESETWKVQRILAGIDQLSDLENLQLVRAYAVQKYQRAAWR